MEAFDIVLIDDQTMDVPLALLAAIENFQKQHLEKPTANDEAKII